MKITEVINCNKIKIRKPDWLVDRVRVSDVENFVLNKEKKRREEKNREGLPYGFWRGTSE